MPTGPERRPASRLPLPERLASLTPRARATLALLGVLVGLGLIVVGLALLS